MAGACIEGSMLAQVSTEKQARIKAKVGHFLVLTTGNFPIGGKGCPDMGIGKAPEAQPGKANPGHSGRSGMKIPASR